MVIQRIQRRSWSLVVTAILLGALVFVWVRPYAIPDWIKLYGYTPPAEISSLADEVSMTSAARHLFYINHSQLQDKTAFRQSCPRVDEQTIIIGCYQSGQRGIFILTVDDERLAGVEQVTAAHEVLHAAYERLSSSEKERINALLSDYQHTKLKDQRVLSAIEGYKKTEPGQELNEIHSMFGTEIAELPQELEDYYARYFTSRRTIVEFADKYQEAFTSREATIADFDLQLKDRQAEIESNTRKLEAQADEIDKERARLDFLREQQNIEAYNDSVDPFNAQVTAYNALLSTTRSLIEQYNAIVEQRNAIAAQTAELQKAIDSSMLPAGQ